MHPRLPADLAASIVVRAALGLQRNGHASGVKLDIDVARVQIDGFLDLPTADIEKLDQHDHNRVTEDGAEAVALALVYAARGWRVVRRMQREEHADWWLEGEGQGSRQTIALEVSGVDRGPIGVRLAEKLAQVTLSLDADQRWASVVGFEKPKAALHPVEANDRGQ
jgi:hypothetical protein